VAGGRIVGEYEMSHLPRLSVCPVDGMAGAVKIAGDAARLCSGGHIQGENLFGSDGRNEGMQSPELLSFLVAPDDFEDGNSRESVITKHLHDCTPTMTSSPTGEPRYRAQ
jgi:hypothetical protein